MSHCGFLLFKVREAINKMIQLEPEILQLIIETKADQKAAVQARKEILEKLVKLEKCQRTA